MAATSKFGLGPYGRGAYSRVVVRESVAVSATSLVAVFAEVRRNAGLIAINAGASVTAMGRLLWERIPAQSCEGRWLPLVSSPYRELVASSEWDGGASIWDGGHSLWDWG